MFAKATLIFIALYRKTSTPGMRRCRFYPSCSQYANDAIHVYGLSAIFLALYRILRCNQFIKGGLDPIT